MRTSNLKLTGAVMALLMTTATGAYAQAKEVGTMAGTTIASTVSISFSRGGAEVTDTASATFYVDRKIDMLMEADSAGDITLDLGEGEFAQDIDFSFTNYSNAEASFTINATAPEGFTEAASGDDTYQIFVDGTAIANGDEITVAAGDEPAIRIVARFDPETNATRSFSVEASPTDAFAEVTGRSITASGSDNMNTIHLFASADQSASTSVVLSSPLLSATKTVAVLSQDAAFDCAEGEAEAGAQAAIPGACVEYTITVNNTGGASMRNLVVTDTMPEGVTLVAAYGAFFDIDTSGASVTATATSNLTNGSDAVLSIRATID